jgi:hypothetical protein
VELVRLSMQQNDALCVLLTGRSERGFSDLVTRMVNSKRLEFDIIGLKPAISPSNEEFSSTIGYKQMFLADLMDTYKQAQEILIYEDRLHHVKAFSEFLQGYNSNRPHGRRQIESEVIHVANLTKNLDPVVEVASIQQMANDHNAIIANRSETSSGGRISVKETLQYTGYLIEDADAHQLASLVRLSKYHRQRNEVIYFANHILISSNASQNIIEKAGGMGSKIIWEVTGTACYENSIWAACVRPVPPTTKFFTEYASPRVLLAQRRGTRLSDPGKIQNWVPVPANKAFRFETTVGQKTILSLESEYGRENADGQLEGLHVNKNSKRKYTANDESSKQYRGQQARNYHTSTQSTRGNHNQGRGGHSHPRGQHTQGRGPLNQTRQGTRGGGQQNRGSRTASRGKGNGGRGKNGHGYRSLDDVAPTTQTSAPAFQPAASYYRQGDHGMIPQPMPTDGVPSGQQPPYSQLGSVHQFPPGLAPPAPHGRPRGGPSYAAANDLQHYY